MLLLSPFAAALQRNLRAALPVQPLAHLLALGASLKKAAHGDHTCGPAAQEAAPSSTRTANRTKQAVLTCRRLPFRQLYSVTGMMSCASTRRDAPQPAGSSRLSPEFHGPLLPPLPASGPQRQMWQAAKPTRLAHLWTRRTGSCATTRHGPPLLAGSRSAQW